MPACHYHIMRYPGILYNHDGSQTSTTINDHITIIHRVFWCKDWKILSLCLFSNWVMFGHCFSSECRNKEMSPQKRSLTAEGWPPPILVDNILEMSAHWKRCVLFEIWTFLSQNWSQINLWYNLFLASLVWELRVTCGYFWTPCFIYLMFRLDRCIELWGWKEKRIFIRNSLRGWVKGPFLASSVLPVLPDERLCWRCLWKGSYWCDDGKRCVPLALIY